jgi:hypothetical protein
MPRIFISHVHEDELVAKGTQRVITHAVGVSAFLSSDRYQVFAGDVWLEKIMRSLSKAEVVVLMLSARSVSRAWVNFEAGAAWLAKKPIIPCCYGTMRKDRLPHPYSGIQALNLKEEPFYLLQSLCHHLHVNVKPARPGTKFGAVRRGLFEAMETALDKFEDI